MFNIKDKTKRHSNLLWNEAIQIWEDLDLFQMEYFSDLENGKISLEDFFQTQMAFYHAVSYFSKPMSALASRIEHTCARRKLVENIYEEHGEMKKELFHENTFEKWLQRLKPDAQVNKRSIPLIPCVDAFNKTLIGVCQIDPVEKGICCLGMIEFMFSYISKCIAESVVKNGWIEKEDLIHYDLHADLDVQHAKDLFEITDKIADPNLKICREGMRLGAFIFKRLYLDLSLSIKAKDLVSA